MMDGMAATTMMPVKADERTMFAPGRVDSVDMLRGLTVAMMLLVNDPGDWEHIFRQLDHAEWNGWTLTDLVFPTFLFLMGTAMVFSMNARMARGESRKTQAGHVALRSAKIFALNMAISLFPLLHWNSMRFYGVLTRIALCYLVAGLVLIATQRPAVVSAVAAALLLVYWVLLCRVPVPGAGVPGRDIPLLDTVMNLTAWIDRTVVAWTQHWLHTGALFKDTSDPEGLLSTLPAVASTLLGSLVGIAMSGFASGESGMEVRGRMHRVQAWLACAGVAGVGLGELWSVWLPVNKNLWTPSFVVLMAGWTSLLLAGCSWLVDGRPLPWPRWLRVVTWPWLVFGANAITAYVISEAAVNVMLAIRIMDEDGDRHTLWELVYQNGFARWGSNEWTSLAFAVTFVVFCFMPLWWMWRKRIWLRV